MDFVKVPQWLSGEAIPVGTKAQVLREDIRASKAGEVTPKRYFDCETLEDSYVPETDQEIEDFIVNDVEDTADRYNYHDGDFAIAFRRFLEKDSEV